MKILGTVLAFVALICVIVALNGWIFMVAVGVVHSFWHSIPPLSYKRATELCLAVSLILGLIKGAIK